MTILFAGGEMGAFIPADADCVELSTGSFNSSFARCALLINGATTYAESAHWTNETDCWLHFDLLVDRTTGSGSETTYLSAYDSSDTEVYRIRMSQASAVMTVKQYYWNGSTFTQLGTSFTTNMDTLNTFDVHVDFSASGSGTIYLSGTQRLTGTADLSGLNGISYVRLRGSLECYYSQVMAADESTIGWRLKTVPATGAGATTDWTGTYAEIDEIVYSDADFINSDTADQVELFSHGSTIPTGYVVNGVAVTARAKCGTGGPQNLQMAIRSGGTTYVSSSIALDAGYTANVNIWETDPATSAAFTTSAITSLQFGVKSIT